jgi:hypothetical protein
LPTVRSDVVSTPSATGRTYGWTVVDGPVAVAATAVPVARAVMTAAPTATAVVALRRCVTHFSLIVPTTAVVRASGSRR